MPQAQQAALRDTMFWSADMRRAFAAPAEVFAVARTLSPDIVVLSDDGGLPDLERLLGDLRHDPATHDAIVVVIDAGRPPGPLPGHPNALVLPADFSASGDEGAWHAQLEEMLHVRHRREARVVAEFPVDTVVTLLDRGVRRFQTTCVNISSRGMLIETPENLPRSSRVELSFQLAGVAAPIAVVGEIVRTAETADGHKLAGIHFTVIRKEARIGIRDFLRSRRPDGQESV
jgi:hypothetical protein